MIQLNDNVRQEIAKLIPPSVTPDIVCFVLNDNFPRSDDRFDISFCTKNGILLEYLQRELCFSLQLDTEKPPIDLRIMRNRELHLYYLVATVDEVFIVSRKDKKVFEKLSNVEKYSVNDISCSGQAYLKVYRKDDAVPIVFDDNFNKLGDKALLFGETSQEENLPLVNQLKQKLVEAQYNVKCNTRTLKEYSKLRQKAALAAYNRSQSSKDSIFKNDNKNNPEAPTIHSSNSFVNVCNQKLIIMKLITNENKESLENVTILLNSKSGTSTSLVHKTRIYEKLNEPPFWREKSSQNVSPNCETAVVCVMDLKEIELYVHSRLEIILALCYYIEGIEYLVPLEHVVIPPSACISDEFDVLSSQSLCENTNTILSTMATADRIDLRLRHIRTDETESNISFVKMFCELGMEMISENKILIYKKSPHHILYGTMIVFSDGILNEHVVDFAVYARSQNQVLSLIRLIYDTVPAKLLITAQNYAITAKNPDLSHYNEIEDQYKLNYKEYASSALRRTNLILEYLDNSMIKMSESNNSSTLNKIGTSIDLFASGVEKFKEFKSELIKEGRRGIEVLNVLETDDNVMVID